jgi:hypothetical protein
MEGLKMLVDTLTAPSNEQANTTEDAGSVIGAAVREALNEHEDAESAARALRDMADADDTLFRAIATPNMDRICLELVRRANLARNYRMRQSIKPVVIEGEKSSDRLARIAERKKQAWLDNYYVGRRRLGDMTGAELLPFAEQHEKAGRTELVTARWLRAIAAKAKGRVVRNVLEDDEIGRLREKCDREA